MRTPYLHEAYNAVSVGLQSGIGAVLFLCLLRLFGVCSCACACPCAAFWLGTLLGTVVALHVGAWRLPAYGRGVLVTGCDSGLGLKLAVRLQALGCTVFAGCLRAQVPDDQQSDGVRQLRQLPRVHVLQLDVTDDQQVEAARLYVAQHQPLKGLWGVVNNAGLFYCNPMEWTTPEAVQRIINVNTLGALRVSKAFLPLLRRSRGRIVNISSAAGRHVAPLFTTYSMSKYALEALTDGLRFEQRRFGVQVVAVEPGNFAASTNILQTAAPKETFTASWERLSQETRAAYGEDFINTTFDALMRGQAAATAHSQDTSPVMAALEHALLGRWPAARYHPSDFSLLLRTWLNTHGPEWLHEALYT